jgi:hypothetical protein
MLPSGCGRAPERRRPRRGVTVALAALFVVLALGSTGLPARADSSNDPRAERDTVRAKKADLASQVNALHASDTEVDQALQALDDNVRGQQAAYSDAERAASEAEREAVDARAAEEAKQAEIEVLRDKVATFAVDAYVKPPADTFLESFEATDASEAMQRKALMELQSGRDTDVLDELRAAERELAEAREQAEEASERATNRRDEARRRLGDVQAARSQQEQFATQVQQRLDAKLGEAAALDATDRALSQQISQQESELAARLRRTVPVGAGGGGGGGGGGAVIPISGSIPLANVRGIVVAASIAGQTEALLSAAAAAGFSLSGTGYRDSSSQVQLRMQHCGTSQYAIYQMPADECSPPTARPGASKHEQGLAIDFSWNGGIISSRSSPAFQWLAANAGRFGFANLPSEPWHWSVGGG